MKMKHGLNTHEGQWLGGEVFVSFDRQAVALLKTHGVAAELLPLSSAR